MGVLPTLGPSCTIEGRSVAFQRVLSGGDAGTLGGGGGCARLKVGTSIFKELWAVAMPALAVVGDQH